MRRRRALAASRPALAGEANDSFAPGDPAWLYDSPLIVHEEIDDLGDGFYRYSYSFENIDSKHIWHFLVYTVFPIGDGAAAWTGRSNS